MELADWATDTSEDSTEWSDVSLTHDDFFNGDTTNIQENIVKIVEVEKPEELSSKSKNIDDLFPVSMQVEMPIKPAFVLTKEQHAIITSLTKNSIVTVNAFAGTGKTTILYELTKAYPEWSFLYLVFNTALKNQADSKFSNGNTEVKTIHSFALSFVKDTLNIFRRKNGLQNGLQIQTIQNALKIKNYKQAFLIKSMFNAFCHSEYEKFNEETIKLLLNDDKELKLDFAIEGIKPSAIMLYVKTIWQLIEADKMPITHDFYLKFFQLNFEAYADSINYDVLLLDECITGDHYVKTSKGNIYIKSLYNKFIENKQIPLIKSFNINTKKFEYKKLLNVLKSENRDVYLIKTEGLNKLKGTLNQPILTQRGYVKLNDLKQGIDILYLDENSKQKTKYLLNDDQKQLVIGSFLGDGSLDKRSKYNTYTIKFTHGIKQIEYLKFKCDIFNIKKITNIKSGYTKKKNIYQSNRSKTFIIEKPMWEYIEDIDARGLAIWYMDDGSISNDSIMIHSNDFNFDEHLIMQRILKTNFDIECSISLNGSYYYLRLNVENSKKLLTIVKPFMKKELYYKNNLCDFNDCIEEYIWNNNFLSYGGNIFTNIEYLGKFTVYDLTIEDNHNFITMLSYYSTGIIVHNCQDSNHVTCSIFSKVLGKKIVVGDMYQSCYKFRKAVNIMKKIDSDINLHLTTTFRFGNNIAEKANYILNDLLGEEHSIVSFIADRSGQAINTTCFISRTNAMLIRQLDAISLKNKIAKTIRKPDDIFSMSLSLYYYLLDKYKYKDQITEKRLWQFKSKNEIKEYATIINDVELLVALKLVEDYQDRLVDLYNIAKDNYRKRKDIDMFLSTAHSAKGLEFDKVIIADDFPDLCDILAKNNILTIAAFKNNIKKQYEKFQYIIEEFNLFYIAITRGIIDSEILSKNSGYLFKPEEYLDEQISMFHKLYQKKLKL